MNAKHTPGPWRVDSWDYSNRTPAENDVPTIRTNTDAVAQALDLWSDFDKMDRTGERDANARLIAAAPDLLAALETLTASLDWEEKRSGTTYHGIDSARAAIAKAKGE